MQMHAQRHTNICLSLTHCLAHTHTKYYVIGFLVLPSAGDDDGISRLVCGIQGATKQTISGTKNEGKEGGRGGEKHGALGRFPRGQDKKRGLH